MFKQKAAELPPSVDEAMGMKAALASQARDLDGLRTAYALANARAVDAEAEIAVRNKWLM